MLEYCGKEERSKSRTRDWSLFHYRSKYQRKTSFPLVICSLIRTFAADYEKSRNEKNRNMENPFKFGTIVEAEYFTDRIEEVAYISHFERT